MRNNQSGRTMLEMLCVLAIIGVLTLGGLRGYRYVVARYKANKIAEAIAFIVTQIRTGYSTQENYAGLDNSVAIEMGAVPEHLIERDNHGEATGKLPTPWGGYINIFPSPLREDSTIIDPNDGSTIGVDGFIVEIGNISRVACNLLITNDWGNTAKGGFVGIAASTATCSTGGNGTAATYAGGKCKPSINDNYGLDSIYLGKNYEARSDHNSSAGYAYGIPGSQKWSIPVAPATASKGCNCTSDANMEVEMCSFATKFY